MENLCGVRLVYGVKLNQFVVSILAAAVGYREAKAKEPICETETARNPGPIALFYALFLSYEHERSGRPQWELHEPHPRHYRIFHGGIVESVRNVQCALLPKKGRKLEALKMRKKKKLIHTSSLNNNTKEYGRFLRNLDVVAVALERIAAKLDRSGFAKLRLKKKRMTAVRKITSTYLATSCVDDHFDVTATFVPSLSLAVRPGGDSPRRLNANSALYFPWSKTFARGVDRAVCPIGV